MNDTTPEMQKFQYELIMSKTPSERFMLGLEMAEAGRELMISGIRMQNPGIDENQMVTELIKHQFLFDKSLFWLSYIIKDLED